MFFYSQSIETILRKQNLSGYIESLIVNERSGRKVMPSPKLVQVVTINSVSDGQFDYPCTFTCEKYKKGSYLRLIKWEVNTRSCELAIHEAQYLGGAGCEVKHGKKWDNERLKMLATSKVLSKHFVVLHEPTPAVAELQYPQLDYAALNKVLSPKKHYSNERKEVFEKLKKPYAPEQQRGNTMEAQKPLATQQSEMQQNTD